MAKVLLADSSVTIQKVVELVLQDKGFELKAVNSGGEALAALESFSPDMVIADIKLQDINGYELAEKVRSSAVTQNVPVLLITGAFDPIDEELREKSGANDSIIKPFESADLLEKINALLEEPAATGEAVEEEAVAEVVAEEISEEEVVEVMVDEEEGGIDESLLSMAEIDEDIEEVEVVEEISEEEVGVSMVEDEELEAEVVEVEMAEGEELEAEMVAEVAPLEGEELEAEVVEVEMAEDEVEAEMIEEVAPLEVEEAIPQPTVEAAPKPTGVAAPQAPSSSDMLSIFSEEVNRKLSEIDVKIMDTVEAQLSDLLNASTFKDDLLEAITPDVKESVEKILWKVAPEMTEKIIKETVSESLASLKNEMQNIIWETVPDLAESIIKETIEKIRSES
jgi:DNA-binding response OmpR family regulator